MRHDSYKHVGETRHNRHGYALPIRLEARIVGSSIWSESFRVVTDQCHQGLKGGNTRGRIIEVEVRPVRRGYPVEEVEGKACIRCMD